MAGPARRLGWLNSTIVGHRLSNRAGRRARAFEVSRDGRRVSPLLPIAGEGSVVRSTDKTGQSKKAQEAPKHWPSRAVDEP